MAREEVRHLILMEVGDARRREENLVRQKADADGPRTSWHSTLHHDIERNLAQVRNYIVRCLNVLDCLDDWALSEITRVGSIVTLSIKGDVGKYILVEEGGGAVGDYMVLSAKSPIGKAILGKRKGEGITITAPDGAIPVKILAVA